MDVNQSGVLSSLVEIEVSDAAQRDTVLGWLVNDFAPLALTRPPVKSVKFEADTAEAEAGGTGTIELLLMIEGETLGDAAQVTNDVLEDIQGFVHARSKSLTFEETSRTLTRS